MIWHATNFKINANGTVKKR